MESHGLHCVGCAANPQDTIEAGAKYHGMSDEEITGLVTEINDILAKGETSIPAKQADVEEFRKNPLKLTENASRKLINALKEQNKPEYGLRVTVSSGGCSGNTYGMDIVEAPKKGDFIIQSNGIKVFVDSKNAELLKGMEIDYVDTLQSSGFKFNNPNASSSCGCGKSFN
jgi:iron-sulfur cluster assembly accessory protein